MNLLMNFFLFLDQNKESFFFCHTPHFVRGVGFLEKDV